MFYKNQSRAAASQRNFSLNNFFDAWLITSLISNFQVTISTKVNCTFQTTTKQYVGEPIQCWAPNHFSHAWIEYTNHVKPVIFSLFI